MAKKASEKMIDFKQESFNLEDTYICLQQRCIEKPIIENGRTHLHKIHEQLGISEFLGVAFNSFDRNIYEKEQTQLDEILENLQRQYDFIMTQWERILKLTDQFQLSLQQTLASKEIFILSKGIIHEIKSKSLSAVNNEQIMKLISTILKLNDQYNILNLANNNSFSDLFTSNDQSPPVSNLFGSEDFKINQIVNDVQVEEKWNQEIRDQKNFNKTLFNSAEMNLDKIFAQVSTPSYSNRHEFAKCHTFEKPNFNQFSRQPTSSSTTTTNHHLSVFDKKDESLKKRQFYDFSDNSNQTSVQKYQLPPLSFEEFFLGTSKMINSNQSEQYISRTPTITPTKQKENQSKSNSRNSRTPETVKHRDRPKSPFLDDKLQKKKQNNNY